MERGYIVWTGTAFNCPSLYNKIWFYGRSNTTYQTCNNGTIVARGLSVEGNSFYTSQLNVTVIPDTAGKTIDCFHDNGTHFLLIFSSIIPG
jgi:hypothetical protein